MPYAYVRILHSTPVDETKNEPAQKGYKVLKNREVLEEISLYRHVIILYQNLHIMTKKKLVDIIVVRQNKCGINQQ